MQVVPFASAQTSSGQHVIQKWHHLASTDNGNKDGNVKTKSHGGPRWGSEGRLTLKGTVKQCCFKRNLQRWTALHTGHDDLTVLHYERI